MRRHDDEYALSLAEGDTTGATLQPDVAALAQDYRRLLGALQLAKADTPPLPSRLGRWARAWVDTRRPEPERPLSHFLRVLATNAPAPAVRNGHAGGSAVLYGDERHHVDLRVEPTSGDGHRLRGQVLSLDTADDGPWHVSIVTADGAVRMTDSDAAGEFLVDGIDVTAGTGLVAQRGEARLVVPRLEELEPIEA